MPLAGEAWVRNETLACAKHVVGRYALQHCPNAEGLFGDRSKRRYEELACDLIPDLSQVWRNFKTNKNPLGYTLVRRAAFCLDPSVYKHGKNEIKRFEDMPATFQMVEHALRTNSPMPRDLRFATMEKEIKIKYRGQPGCYIMQDPALMNRVYFGATGNFGKRNHTDSPLMMIKAFLTFDVRAAFDLEACIHAELEILKVKRQRGEGTKGLYEFADGLDGIDLISGLCNGKFRHFFRNFAAVEGISEEISDACDTSPQLSLSLT